MQMQYEKGVNPEHSPSLGLVANMSEVMLSMYRSAPHLNSCFVATTDGCILCVVNEKGQVLFSPQKEGLFKPELSAKAPDLRESGNAELAAFVSKALQALNEVCDASPEQVLHHVREAVDGFVKEAEQFDDLTMLCLQYIGGNGNGS
ncbi:MAG: hypothetical protein IJR00_04930 [Lachnospiraceae bacterium]|nr:hypothetical protein [Lachnospiraceae bacterium]